MPKRRPGIEIPADWAGRDRHLWRLAKATGFRTENRLLAFVAYEVAHCKTPAVFYRALSAFHEYANAKRKR